MLVFKLLIQIWTTSSQVRTWMPLNVQKLKKNTRSVLGDNSYFSQTTSTQLFRPSQSRISEGGRYYRFRNIIWKTTLSIIIELFVQPYKSYKFGPHEHNFCLTMFQNHRHWWYTTKQWLNVDYVCASRNYCDAWVMVFLDWTVWWSLIWTNYFLFWLFSLKTVSLTMFTFSCFNGSNSSLRI